jgi:hypothetical protein
MISPKIKIIAVLRLIPAVISTVIGYGFLIPKYGSWGIAYTAASAALMLFYGGSLFSKKEPTQSPDPIRIDLDVSTRL